MSFKGAMLSSASNEWRTPQALYDVLHDEFRFTLDAAATADNAKCDKYITAEDDALTLDWHAITPGYWRQTGDRTVSVWCNPPYGRGVGKWVKKAYEESLKGCCVVVLVMARVDTLWWHHWATKAAEIRLIKGRVWFEHDDKAQCASPSPSAVLVFDEARRRPVISHVELPRR